MATALQATLARARDIVIKAMQSCPECDFRLWFTLSWTLLPKKPHMKATLRAVSNKSQTSIT